MPDNAHVLSSHNIFSREAILEETTSTQHDGRQDNGAASRARVSTAQPDPVDIVLRSPSPSPQAKPKKATPKRRTVHLTLWVKPAVKAELERIAKRENVSVSSTGSAFLEKAMQQQIDLQYGALLEPIIRESIARHMRAISTRLAFLLVRVAFDAGQTRSLVTNILGRQPGVDPEILKTILESSGKSAKSNITRRTPQLTELIDAVEQWISEAKLEEEQSTGKGARA